jgi:hypothetical protein
MAALHRRSFTTKRKNGLFDRESAKTRKRENGATTSTTKSAAKAPRDVKERILARPVGRRKKRKVTAKPTRHG